MIAGRSEWKETRGKTRREKWPRTERDATGKRGFGPGRTSLDVSVSPTAAAVKVQSKGPRKAKDERGSRRQARERE